MEVGANHLSAASIAGQVVDQETGIFIEGARVRVLANAQEEEAEQRANLLGMFNIKDLEEGSKTLKVSHPAYLEQSVNVIVNAAQVNTGQVELPRRTGMEQFLDLTLQVRGVTSNARLPDATVEVRRFATAAADTLQAVRVLRTNAQGNITAYGLRPGFYQFQVEREGWESLTHPSGTEAIRLAGDHFANIGLKPVTQTLNIRVNGFDPNKWEPGTVRFGPGTDPIAGATVEVTGLALNRDAELIPTRSLVTGPAGQVAFDNLPPVRWKVEAKKLGYEAGSTITEALKEDAGTTPIGMPIHEETRFRFVLDSIYEFKDNHFEDPGGLEEDLDFPADAVIRLEGVPGTPTEGFSREVSSAEREEDSGEIVQIVDEILPGQYYVEASLEETRFNLKDLEAFGLLGNFAELGRITVRFRTQRALLEIGDREEREHTFVFEPLPAVVEGRLRALEALSRSPDPEPTYTAKGGITIEFVRPQEPDYLPGESKVFETRTDSAGNFRIELPPGHYGIRIPELSDYASKSVNSTMADFPESWPIAEPWPHEGTGNYAGPRIFASGEKQDFVITVSKKFVQLVGTVARASDQEGFEEVYNPHEQTFTGGLGTINVGLLDVEPGTLQLSHSDPEQEIGDISRTPFTTPFPVPGNAFLIEKVPPGEVSVGFSHPQLTVNSLRLQRTFAPNSFPEENLDSADYRVRIADPGAPGSVPETDPAEGHAVPMGARYSILGVEEAERSTWLAPGSSDKLTIFMLNFQSLFSGSPDINEFFYDPNLKEYRGGGVVEDSFVELDAFPGFLFEWAPGFAPTRNATYYFHNGSEWAVREAASVFNLFDGGPDDDFSSANAPAFVAFGNYELEVRTVLASGEAVEGLTVRISTDETEIGQVQTPGTLEIDAFSPDNFLVPGIVSFHVSAPLGWEAGERAFTRAIQNPPKMTLDLSVERKMAVSGVVRDPDGNGLGAIEVAAHNRQGERLQTVTTDEGGNFIFTEPPLETQTVFLRIDEAGFIPVQRRFPPPPAETQDLTGIVLELEALPKPVIREYSVDTNGFFIPGVLKSGDGQIDDVSDPSTAFDVNNAAGTLTAIWTVEAETEAEEEISYEIDRFPGDGGGTGSIQTTDRVVGVYLIDPRVFPGNPLTQASDEVDSLPISRDIRLSEFSDLLGDIRRGQKDGDSHNVVWGRGTRSPLFVENAAQDRVRGSKESDGKFRGKWELWKLPPGEFDPVVVVITEMGALRVLKDVAPNEAPLVGASLGSWASKILNVVGTMANYQLNEGGLGEPGTRLKGILPQGSTELSANLDFSGAIDRNPLNDFLTYEYQLGAEFKEGQKTPEAGLLSYGPQWMGIQFKGTLGFNFNGKSGEASLFGDAEASRKFAEDKQLTRTAFLGSSGNFIPITLRPPNVRGQVRSTIVKRFGNPDRVIPDFEMKRRVRGLISGGLDINLTQAAGNAALVFPPPVGPILSGLKRSGALTCKAFFESGLGAEVEAGWSTVLPKPGGGTITESRPSRRNLLGVTQSLVSPESDTQFDFNILFRTEGGLILGLGRDRLQGRISMELGSPPNIELPGVKVSINENGNMPVIERVEGSLNTNIGFKADILGISYEVEKNLAAMRIDVQYGTEAFFQLIPFEEQIRVIRPETNNPSNWINEDGVLVEDFFAGGRLHLAKDGEGGIVYSRPGPQGESLELVVSVPGSGGDYQLPRVVARGPGVLGIALGTLPEGRRLLAWAEPLSGDVGDPFGGSRIRYVTSDSGGATWSTPVTLTEISSGVASLRMAEAGSSRVLLWKEPSEGIFSARSDLKSAVFAQGSFGEPFTVLESTRILEMDFAGGAEGALLVLVDQEGKVRLFFRQNDEWSEESFSESTDSQTAIATVFASEGNLWFASAGTGGRISLFKRNGGSWSQTGLSLSATRPENLQLLAFPEGSQVHLLLAWIEKGANDRIRYTFLDSDGLPFTEVRTATADDRMGILDNLQTTRPLNGRISASRLVFEHSPAFDSANRTLMNIDLLPGEPPDRPGQPDDDPSSEWAGYPRTEGEDVDTGSWLGWVNVAHAPVVYIWSLDSWVFLPESAVQEEIGGWMFVFNETDPEPPSEEGIPTWGPYAITKSSDINTGAWLGWLNVHAAPFLYSWTLQSWLYFPESAITDHGGWLYAFK